MDPCALNGFFTAEQRARFLQSAAQRVSIRSFTGMPSDADCVTLEKAAARYELPGVRLVPVMANAEKLYPALPGVGGIRGSDYAFAIVADRAAHSAVYAGISGEALALEAVSMGLGTCWSGSARKRAADVQLNKGERILAVLAVGTYEKEIILRKRKKLSRLCRTDPASWPYWAYSAAETVRIAPSAMNLQPWRLSYTGHLLVLRRHGPASMLDKGIALLHMHIGMGEREHVLEWGEKGVIARLRVKGEIK